MKGTVDKLLNFMKLQTMKSTMKNMKSTKTMRKKRKNQEVLSPSLRRKSLK